MSGARFTVCMLAALLVSTAFAEESGFAPLFIKRRAPFGTEISCPHFRARMRSHLRSIGELWQLAEYFKHRLAADPLDIAGQRVADVTWSIPKSSFPPDAQVL